MAIQDTYAQQLAESVKTMTDLLSQLQPPLMAYLETVAPHHQETHAHQSVSALLSASPIAPLLADDDITDIFINGHQEIYINRGDALQKTDLSFPDAKNLHTLANAIASSVGRALDHHRPLVDARLRDGSRVNIIAPPMAIDGLTMSIRKFPKQEIVLETLIEKGEMSGQMAEFLKLCAECRVSLLISGGTGTGKTTLLNAISRFIPASERIITIEDTAELRLQQPHVVRLEIKEPHIITQRVEEVNASDLLRNALRMRPDRIIVGEVRGDEAYDMIQALNTGHDGSMTTVHANTPRDAFARIENLLGPRMQNTPAASVRQQIVSAIHLIIQLVYNTDGTRMVSSISEVVGMEGEIPTMQEIFKLHQDPATHKYTQTWSKIIPRQARLAQAIRESAAFAAPLGEAAKAY
jgi:pilus assembly protein CpaF